ncbi:MAG TPA: hypothetical protein PL181_16640, partial [bacterium]|nr:hypothetical protein [bacterium]
KREEIREQLPLTFTMGAAMNLFDLFQAEPSQHQLTLSVDFVHPNNYTERMNAGLELLLLHKLALRGGYQGNQDVASWSAGFGVRTSLGGSDLAVDYAWSFMDTFADVSRFSLGIGF